MAQPSPKPKKGPAPALAAMTKTQFAAMMRELNELHQAADDGAMAVASGYKNVKKAKAINLESLKLVRKLSQWNNPAKVQSFLADFDKLRELAGFDDQQNLFEEDKTKPQKDGESAKVVNLRNDKPSNAETAAAVAEVITETPKAKKAVKGAKGGGKPAATKAALFDEGDGDLDEIAEEVAARQAGLIAGKTGTDYDNPHTEKGPLRDAFHQGWVEGSESASAEPGDKASA